MPPYTTEEIIQGFTDKNKEILQWVNSHHLPQITRMVTANSGTAADAEDLLQNALISLWNKAQKNQLVVYTEFSYFLNMICHRQWMRMLRDRKREHNHLTALALETDDRYNDYDEIFEEVTYFGIYQKHFQQLPPKCRQILTLFNEKRTIREIASLMGYKSEMYVKKLKYECKERLAKNIRNDPQYKKFIQDEF